MAADEQPGARALDDAQANDARDASKLVRDAGGPGSAAELARLLEEKDQLVEALTARLEEAAEQLDRQRRSGGLRGGVEGPADLSQPQRMLTEQLSRAIQQWEDLQPAALLERLSSQVTELQALLEVSAREAISGMGPVTTLASAPRGASSPAPGAVPDASRTWAEMKLELLGINVADDGVSALPQDDIAQPATALLGQSGPDHESAQLPQPIDLESADRSALEAAIEVREAYITYLIRKLHAAEGQPHQAIDWAALNNAPAELRTKLEQLSGKLEELVRREELDLSLERARLSRERTRIDQMRQRVERQLRRAGAQEVDLTAEPKAPAALDGDGRWSRLFGRSKPK